MEQNAKQTKKIRLRVALLLALIVAIGLLFGLRMVYLQLVNGARFQAAANASITYKFKTNAARGEIVDANGVALATNTTGYNVVINKLTMGEKDLNTVLMNLMVLLETHGEAWNDDTLISASKEDGSYAFTNNLLSTLDDRALSAMKSALGLQQYATADDCMAAMVKRYKLEAYSEEWQRKLSGVRYAMEAAGYSNVNNFVFATDIAYETMAAIRESSLDLPGVKIEEISKRFYPDGTVLPHILGDYGQITHEMWVEEAEDGTLRYPLKEKGYEMNDLIGTSGLEVTYEEFLRGTDGLETVTVNSHGLIIDTQVVEQPKQGETVQLTIDSEFNRAVNSYLAQNIQRLAAAGTLPKKACAGAVVVLRPKTGEILALANYPSYDSNLYHTNYAEISSAENNPLINRALTGLYTPGSTFKPCVALAGTLSGTIPLSFTYRCTGVYTYYSGYSPKCVMNGHYGVIGLVQAIEWSCNLYFYEVGRLTTSDVYDVMANQLGLGIQTGVEITNWDGDYIERAGRLTHSTDSNYTPSLDIQAAIGQGNTVVTPVQLATYAATIANKGVRYKTHLVSALLDSTTGQVIERFEPEVVDVIEDPIGAFAAVEQGMRLAAQNACGTVLANYPLSVACKTGSPQLSDTYGSGNSLTHYTNTIMIAYGPTEDAEIAIGIVIEYGNGGSNASQLAVDVFNAYYAAKNGTLQVAADGTVNLGA